MGGEREREGEKSDKKYVNILSSVENNWKMKINYLLLRTNRTVQQTHYKTKF